METLEEFLKRERELLVQFEQYWTKENSLDPKNFPMELDPGAWFEQVRAFDEVVYSQEN